MIERTVSASTVNQFVQGAPPEVQIDPLFEELAARARQEGLVQPISDRWSSMQLPPLPEIPGSSLAVPDGFSPSATLQSLSQSVIPAMPGPSGGTLLGFNLPAGPIRLVSDMLTTDGEIARSDANGILVKVAGMTVAIERQGNLPDRVAVDIGGTRQTGTLRPGDPQASLLLDDGNSAVIRKESDGGFSLTGILPITVKIVPLRTAADGRDKLLLPVPGPARPTLPPPPPLPNVPGDLKWGIWRRPAKDGKPALFGGGIAYTDPNNGQTIKARLRSDGTLDLHGSTQVDGLGGLIAKITSLLSGLFNSASKGDLGPPGLLRGT